MDRIKKIALFVFACVVIGMVVTSCRSMGYCPAYAIELIVK